MTEKEKQKTKEFGYPSQMLRFYKVCSMFTLALKKRIPRWSSELRLAMWGRMSDILNWKFKTPLQNPGSSHIYSNSSDASLWLQWKDVTDGSVQPGWAEPRKLGFHLNYHCRTVKCDSKYLSYHIGQSLSFSAIAEKENMKWQTKLPNSKASFSNHKHVCTML